MQVVRIQNSIICHYLGLVNIRQIEFHARISNYQLCKPCGAFNNITAYRYVCTNCEQLFCLQHYIEHTALFGTICRTDKMKLGKIDNISNCFKHAKHIKPATICVEFLYNFSIQSISTLLRLNQSTHLSKTIRRYIFICN